ncbi:hypothetical protein PVAP13_2NG072200 [Panicum virgatum]|uniref:tRNA ligase phosphodiesterase domain-containing protein n=1 Tax=Panicum virgatum TaxID=38727 RepID=A0A8T0VHZ2_PANVG|nr:hypothetical protein PVAP13_2NG072200 [Panicum virgatum]
MSPASSLLSPHAPRRILPLLLPLRLSSSSSSAAAVSAPALAMPPRRDGTKPPPRKWKPKATDASFSSSSASAAAGIAEPVGRMALAPQEPPRAGPAQMWVPRGYATSAADGPGAASASTSTSAAVTAEQGGAASQKLSSLFKTAPHFEVDNSTFTEAQIRATFYPKFENEKSDQETRTRMIEMVSHGLANLEVTLKHSGSLFMYAGHHGGAYAKNSYGNVYTAVGVFVLGRLFREAWGKEAPKMQAEFNDFLERNRISISMELVTAVLGDHGQRPKDDYAVVTAVTELGHGKPKFYSTPEVIAFCRKWRLPTNHVWLFSTRKSASSFFAAYDALCEEGTATPVCKALDEIADISVPGSKDHVKVQGEILEGLVARIVTRESSVQMEEVLRKFPQPPLDGVDSDLGPSLREICAANRSDEKQQIKALLDNVGASMCPDHSDWFGNSGLDAQSRNADRSVVTKFLQAHPTDYATKKLQRDEEGDLRVEHGAAPSSPVSTSVDVVPKTEGLIVFFPGIPGCAKSALCKEILNTPGGLGDNRPLHSLMGDLIKGKYWQKVADERKKKPARIILADKNAPNEEVWRQIEDMCGSTKAAAVPVVPDSEGTDSNPFSLDALAVFMFRVLQRVNHPGNLDKSSPNAGYVLLMFYHLYDGKCRREFENELYERFGSLVKMPLLRPDRAPLPDAVKTVLDEGISLFRLHQNRHGRVEPSKGSYAKEWARWEQRLRVTLFGNADYLNSIQVPFESAVKEVLEQLKAVAKGDIKTPDTGKRKFGNIMFAAVRLTPADIVGLLRKVSEKDTAVNTFLNETKLEDSLTKAHVTLAHKRGHGVAALASYGIYQHQEVPVSFNALYYTDKMAALEAQLGAVNGEQITSRNEWPHATLWTAPGVTPKEANMLPQLASEGKATRVPIEPPITISGVLDFY